MSYHIYLLDDAAEEKLHSAAYSGGSGGWQTLVDQIKAGRCRGLSLNVDELIANARHDGRMEGIQMAIDSTRLLLEAEESESP